LGEKKLDAKIHSELSHFLSSFFITHFTLETISNTAGCYAMKYGSRGYGHSGISSLGLMCDAKDLEWQWYIKVYSKKKIKHKVANVTAIGLWIGGFFGGCLGGHGRN
jgi:hypothetical protein